MKVTVLGSGTSTGVPVAGGNSPVNQSSDPRDNRLRSSLLIEEEGFRVVIDTGPDFRRQMLDHAVDSLNGVLYTHEHYDHIAGLDDLRPYSFHTPEGLDLYFSRPCYERVIRLYDHIGENSRYYGKPRLNFKFIECSPSGLFEEFQLGPFTVQPIETIHVKEPEMISVGYLFNHKFAYLTDFKEITPAYLGFLHGLDTVIMGAPLPWDHPTHISIPSATELLQTLGVRQGYLTHLSDKKYHSELLAELPDHIDPTYDGMVLNF